MVVTPYAEQELYPSDIHINQNPGGREFGLQNWVDRDEDIVNKDIVAWASFGMTHFARPEEYPIMPVEITRLHLKPVGFFAVSVCPLRRFSTKPLLTLHPLVRPRSKTPLSTFLARRTPTPEMQTRLSLPLQIAAPGPRRSLCLSLYL